MADEDEQVITPDPQEPPQDETPAEEPKEEPKQVEEEPESEAPAEPSQPEEETEESTEETPEEPQMSRRKAKRLEKLETLVDRLKGPEKSAPKSDGIPYREMIQADDEVYDQLEAKSQEFGQKQFDAGLEQAKSIQFHTRLEIDAPRVEAKYPQFDKSSPDFNPGVANAVNQWYLAAVGYDPQTDTVANPNVRYGDFIEGIMELADNMAGVKTAKSSQNIAKQAATTGLRPDGSSAKPLDLSKDPEDMTNEELEAAITSSLPRDRKGRFTSK